MEEVERRIQTKNNKAKGFDGITAEVWKTFCSMKWETIIFNKVRNGKEFPLNWKIAIIHPIYKERGNCREPENYTGISLLSVSGKTSSRILAWRLSEWLRNNKVLLGFQTGIVKRKRTMDNIFITTTIPDKYLRVKRRHISWRFTDLEKAFGSTDREVLWFKIRQKKEKVKNGKLY
jgi:hypothetical protein